MRYDNIIVLVTTHYSFYVIAILFLFCFVGSSYYTVRAMLFTAILITTLLTGGKGIYSCSTTKDNGS